MERYKMIRIAAQKTWGWAESDTRNVGGLSPASPAGSRLSLPGVGVQPQRMYSQVSRVSAKAWKPEEAPP